jgi:hypothetical protein
LLALPVMKGGGKPRRVTPTHSKPGKPDKPSNARRALAMARSDGFSRRVLCLLRDLLGRVQVRRLDLDLRLGFDDPADTGRLWGIIGPVSAVLALPHAARVSVTPVFTEPLLYLDAHAEARIVPAALLLALLGFVFSPITFRAARAAFQGTS